MLAILSKETPDTPVRARPSEHGSLCNRQLECAIGYDCAITIRRVSRLTNRDLVNMLPCLSLSEILVRGAARWLSAFFLPYAHSLKS